MCLFVFYAPPVVLEPRGSKQAARLTMKKGSVFTCSTRPHFHKTKPALWERNLSPFTVCPIRLGVLRECFHLVFWSRRAVIQILYMGAGSECSLGELWPISVRLDCVLIWGCVVAFYCVGKMPRSKVPVIFITERLCERMNSERFTRFTRWVCCFSV